MNELQSQIDVAMKKLRHIPAAFFILSLFFACSPKKGEPVALQSPGSEVATAIPVERPTQEKSESTTEPENAIIVTGYIDVPPGHHASVSPYFGGFVRKINVLVGQGVRKGEVLFTLENPDYLRIQQDYLEAKAQLSYLKADYERQKQLVEEKIASTKNFKKSESDYKVMQARYHSLREQIKLMGLPIAQIESGILSSTISIVAPVNGSITSVNVTRSAYADPKEIAVELVNLDHIHLELDVFEKDVLRIRSGQPISFRIPESGTKTYQGEVHLVGRSVDSQKRTVKVHGHIADQDEVNFMPGMFVEATILIR